LTRYREPVSEVSPSMRAAVLAGPGRIEVRDRPKPEHGPGELILGVEFCGICGTDLHALHGELLPPGSVLGHEATGVVLAAGADCERQVGEHVVLRPSYVCGECAYCQRGDFRLCPEHFRQTIGVGAPGAFAEQVVIKDYMAIPLPTELPLDRAALIEPLACGVHSARIAELLPTDRVVVIGAGPIGLVVVICARAAGVSEIVVFERSGARRRLAAELGADHALALEEAGDAPSWVLDDGADACFECGGARATLDAAVEMTRPGGRLILVALYDNPQPVNLPAVVPKGLTIKAALGSRAEDFQRAVDMVAQGDVPVGAMISDVVGLEDIADAFARLRNPEQAVKILVRPNGER
jgi:(R,R)-butanediol dehydrogenase / meso-butanediol dehydrogenase / diacetyl reductase